jgi:hypothetical protein
MVDAVASPNPADRPFTVSRARDWPTIASARKPTPEQSSAAKSRPQTRRVKLDHCRGRPCRLMRVRRASTSRMGLHSWTRRAGVAVAVRKKQRRLRYSKCVWPAASPFKNDAD